MKTFSMVVLLAFVVMYVFMAESATVVEDDDDSNDLNAYEGKSYDIFGVARSTSSSTNKYTKITKHPLYIFLKGLFKIITKIFDSDNVQLPMSDMTNDNNT